MRKLFLISLILFIAKVFISCESEISGNLQENKPPETTLFIQSPDTLNYTKSIQSFFWDGRDSDGFISGFYYTFAENPTAADWTWTTERSKTFPLNITGQDTIYFFQVKAVDDDQLEDPTPASQRFPVLNSPPEINWSVNSNIPDTTLTVASFAWQATDLDGEETIEFFEYALDDTNEWVRIDGQRRSVILKEADGITAGDHAFFIRAVDIAGSRSEMIRMPIEESKTWHVKNPQGRYLLIDDFAVESSVSGFPDRYYREMMQNVVGEEYTYWNIEELFPSSNNQFIETLKLFERIIWYADLVSATDPHFIGAQLAIPELRKFENNSDGARKIIYTLQFNRGFGAQGDPLEFSPVDSLGKAYNFINANSIYYPDSLNLPEDNIFQSLPVLKVSKIILGMIALKPKGGSIPLYRYDDPATDQDPLFIIAGRNDNNIDLNAGDFDFLFSGTPLHFMNGDGNLDQFFDFVIHDLFEYKE